MPGFKQETLGTGGKHAAKSATLPLYQFIFFSFWLNPNYIEWQEMGVVLIVVVVIVVAVVVVEVVVVIQTDLRLK